MPPAANPLVSIRKSGYSCLSHTDIEELLAPLGGMKRYVNRGERVLLKVNLLAPSEPESAVTTHPSVVGAVADAVLKEGAIPYIGDSLAGLFNKRRLDRVYERSGLKALADEKGIELNYNTKATKIKIPGGIRLKSALICDYVLDADKIIALPKLKTHSLMVMTLATKIMYGAVPGITKAKYHSLFPGIEAFSDMLLDVLSIAKPDLFIMDGIVGMHGNGPKGGEPCAVGALLASDNALAMDVSVCRMLGIEPMEIPLLKRARIRGMAPSEVKYPLLSPEDARFHGFRLPLTAHVFGEKRGMKVPVPNEKCTGCGRCEEICPRGAVKVVGEPWSLKRQTSG